jgi:hypothetical protein
MTSRRYSVLTGAIAALVCLPGLAASADSARPHATGDRAGQTEAAAVNVEHRLGLRTGAGEVHGVRNGLIAFSRYDPVADIDTVWLVDPRGHQEPWQLNSDDFGCPAWSPDGRVLVACDGVPDTSAAFLDPRTGQLIRTLLQPDPTLDVECYKWSPDGARLGCDGSGDEPSQSGPYSVRASDGGDLRQIVSVTALDGGLGGYSPDGKSIVFWSEPDEGDNGLFTADVDGTGTRRLTDTSLIVLSPGDWSPDGKRIIFSARSDPDHRAKVWTIHPDGTHLREVPLRPPGPECGGAFDDPSSVGCSTPAWSPDGRYIVYQHVAADRVDLQVAEEATGRHVRTLTDRMDDGGQRLDVEFPDWQPLLQND